MTVRKRYDNYYYTDFYLNCKRIVRKVPGGVTSKDMAQKWEDDLKYRMLRGEIGLSRANPEISELVEKFLAYSKTNKAPASYRRDEVALRNFVSISGLRKFSQVTPLSVEAYKNQRLGPVSKTTVNLELSTLKNMLNKSIQWSLIAENPIKSVSKIRGPELRPIEFLTQEEISALLAVATPTYRPIIYTFIKTGLRKNELAHLEWDDINFDKKQIRVINKKDHPTKSRRERFIPMDGKIIEVLLPLKDNRSKYVFATKDGSLRANNLIREVKRFARKAGITKNVTIHMLRHTCASHLVMAGVDLRTVKEILGHADIQTTIRYSHLAPDHLRDSISKLPF